MALIRLPLAPGERVAEGRVRVLATFSRGEKDRANPLPAAPRPRGIGIYTNRGRFV